jgi:hypothetical protein
VHEIRRLVAALGLLSGFSIPMAASAQGGVTPVSHWGGVMLPEAQPRSEYALHFVGFTQYGKELIAGTHEYTFTPYNDIGETLGFNIFSYTRSGPSLRFTAGDDAVSRRHTYTVGLVSDWATQRLQNRVIHWANWRGDDRLDRVPRRKTDTPESTSDGPTKWTRPLVGASEEYFVHLVSSRTRAGREERFRTPLFAGGGYAFSTINQELFLQAGSDIYEISFRPGSNVATSGGSLPRIFGLIRIASLGAGGMARSGVLLPGMHFKDLTASYVNIQAVARLGLEVHEQPVQIDLALTSAEGFFVAKRDSAQLEMIEEVGHPPEKVYAAKLPMRERFMSIRVRSGSFTFETFNDFAGGKDKGPSFGAQIAFSGDVASIFQNR